MAGSNAGKKRNVFARDDPDAWHWDARFSSLIKQLVDAAAEESGNFSPALYLEVFIRNYVAEHGELPAFNLALVERSEVIDTKAA